MYTKKHRTLALLTCGAFFIITLFSVLLIASEADHDCMGENCPVCACIHHAEQTLKQLGMGIAGAVSLISAAGLLVLTVFGVCRTAPRETPISQKVRSNN